MTGKQRVISAFVLAILILDLSFFIARDNLPDALLCGNPSLHERSERIVLWLRSAGLRPGTNMISLAHAGSETGAPMPNIRKMRSAWRRRRYGLRRQDAALATR